MLADASLTAHFHLSQFTASPDAGRVGLRNEPLSHQVENLRRLAQALEVVSTFLYGARVHVLRGFRRSTVAAGSRDPAAEGRSADFIVPGFGAPRDVCAHLVAQGIAFDRLVCCPDWVQLDIPEFGAAPRRQLQTGVFEHGRTMRVLEGLL